MLIPAWGCGDDNNDGEDQSANDTAEHTTDFASDDAEDGGTDDEPNADLGTDPPEATYDGFEELYILTADDDPVNICRVRFDLVSVAEPAVPCTECEWDVVVERRDPEVMLNVNNTLFNLKKGSAARPNPGHLLWFMGQGVWADADADEHAAAEHEERTGKEGKAKGQDDRKAHKDTLVRRRFRDL